MHWRYMLKEKILFFANIRHPAFLCDNVKGVIQYRGKNVCPDCINKLKAKL